MRLFITGATGYIGSALCRRWVADGHDVTALVRPTSRTGELVSLGVSLVVGDITNGAGLESAVNGVDWFVHAAAELDMEVSRAQMESVNTGGCEEMASLAARSGVKRFLSISSIASFGGSPDDGSPATEESLPREPLPTNYSATKNAGEAAIRAWQERGLAVNTVYPSLVYGPPGKKRGANSMLRILLAEQMPVAIGGDRWVTWIYLEDLVEGISRVMKQAPPGRDYLLTGEPVTIAQLSERVCELGGVRPPRIPVPLEVVQLAMGLASPMFRLIGKRPPFGPQGLANLRRHWKFDDSRARRELDWEPRGLDEGLPPTIAMLRR